MIICCDWNFDWFEYSWLYHAITISTYMLIQWDTICGHGEYNWIYRDHWLYYLVFTIVPMLRTFVSGIFFLSLCLLSVYLRIVSCLSEPRLLEVSRAVRLHWRVRGFKLRALADRGNIMFCAKKKVTHVWIHLQARKSIMGNSFYLKFELSLAMRGKAVMSTEKRWAL